MQGIIESCLVSKMLLIGYDGLPTDEFMNITVSFALSFVFMIAQQQYDIIKNII